MPEPGSVAAGAVGLVLASEIHFTQMMESLSLKSEAQDECEEQPQDEPKEERKGGAGK